MHIPLADRALEQCISANPFSSLLERRQPNAPQLQGEFLFACFSASPTRATPTSP